jgi:hypothetical protein
MIEMYQLNGVMGRHRQGRTIPDDLATAKSIAIVLPRKKTDFALSTKPGRASYRNARGVL